MEHAPCAQFFQQLSTQHRCVASCWRIVRCNRVPRRLETHLSLLRTTLHAVGPSSTFRNNRSNRACVFLVNPNGHRPRHASFPKLSRHKSLQVAQIALHDVTPHLSNCNENIFQCCVSSCWEIFTVKQRLYQVAVDKWTDIVFYMDVHMLAKAKIEWGKPGIEVEISVDLTSISGKP